MCICGALPEEQDRRQPYEFDIDLIADLPATESDDLNDTIDYGGVLNRIEAVTLDESFQLFERMAQRVAEAVLEDERIEQVTVEVRKLRPPVAQDVASSGMRLTRRRG
ncbi:MAG: dihydroneopterin aldolase [Candidatus Aldehydirespiratoraceae bacterium]|jgi:dihydroneopterin aldolase